MPSISAAALARRTHLRRRALGARDLDGLGATVLASLQLVLHWLALLQATKALCIDASLQQETNRFSIISIQELRRRFQQLASCDRLLLCLGAVQHYDIIVL